MLLQPCSKCRKPLAESQVLRVQIAGGEVAVCETCRAVLQTESTNKPGLLNG
jgi:RNase P subunit RPR2